MSEANRNQVPPPQRGGAHIAKSGSKISISAEKEAKKKASEKDVKKKSKIKKNSDEISEPVIDQAPDTGQERKSSLQDTQPVPSVFTPSAVAPPPSGNNEEPKPTSIEPIDTRKRNRYADKMNKKKSKGRKRVGVAIAVLAVALLTAGGVYVAVGKNQQEVEVDPNSIAVVTRGALETYVEGNGFTAANLREDLGKDMKGTISEVLVEVGDEVKKDDILIVLNPTETQNELKAAEQELSAAQREVSSAQDDVRTARDEVQSIQQSLGKLSVTAPFTGKIIPVEDSDGVAKEYRVGQQVSSGETVGYMIDDSQMKLSLYYNAAYEGAIQEGQTANVTIPATSDSLIGTVTSVDPTQRLSTEGVKLIRVTVSIINPGTLVKGMSATATVSAGEEGDVYPTDASVLEYNREEAVTTPNSGEIATINGIDYYDYASGSTIMTLTSETLQSELKSAQNRVNSLQNGVTSAQRQVQTIQTRINELKQKIANATVKATMDGVVVNLNAEAGQEAGGADALVTIADLSEIIVNAEIDSADVMNVEPGQLAVMTSYQGDGSELTLTGTVQSVALEPDQESQSGGRPMFPAVIEVDPVEGQSIPIGQSVDYRITTASSYDSLMIPSAAIVNTESGTAVFAKPMEGETFDETLPIPEGTEGIPEDFVLVPVETGLFDSTTTEILWGVSEGTTVYLVVQDMYSSMEGAVG